MTRRRAPFLLAVAALLLGMAPGGPGGGQSSGCSPGVSVDVSAASTPGHPRRVATGAGVTCPTPEASGGGIFGGGNAQRQMPPPGVPGQDCTGTVIEPTELSLTPGGQMQVFWPDPSFQGTGSDTPEPQDLGRVLSGIAPKQFFMQAGTTDYFLPFRLDGKWDASGRNCVPKDPAHPQDSFSPICTGATVNIGCLIAQPHGIAPGPLGIGALNGIDLRGQMLQLVHPGQITSLPAQPNPALVNAPTCFFVNGADIDGQDVNQPATFELVLLSGADASNRQVYYVFRVELALQGVEWQFGDNSGQTEPLPPPCVGVSNAPLQFAHRYLRYSQPEGFEVRATETFTIHVTEYWYDSAGTPHAPLDLGDLQPIQIQPGPAPVFRKVVVQEEGVPIG